MLSVEAEEEFAKDNETLCAIWYHLYNLENVKNIHGGVSLLVKLEASACNFTKCNTPPWVFFTFLKLCKWYQIAQRARNRNPVMFVVYGDSLYLISYNSIVI